MVENNFKVAVDNFEFLVSHSIEIVFFLLTEGQEKSEALRIVGIS